MKRLTWCAALAISLAVASCAGQLNSAGKEGHAPPASDPAPAELAFAGNAVEELDVLRMALTRPESFVPAEVSLADQSAVIVADLLYDGLTEAAGRDGELRPGLAIEWSTDETFSEWTFVLDSDRITAQEVHDHFATLMGSDLSSTTAQLLAPVASVEAVATDVVHFSLRGPNAGFAWLMSGLGASVVGPEGRTTGRFVSTSTTDSGMNLVAADDVHDLVPSSVALRWTDDADAAYDVLTLGLADVAVAPHTAMADAARRFGHEPVDRSITVFYGVALGDESAVRQAVVGSVDRAAVAEHLSDLGAVPADGIVAGSLAGAKLAIPVPAAELAAGEWGGAAAEIVVAYTDDAHSGLAEVIVEGLVAAGRPVVVLQRTPEEQAGAIASGSAGLFAFGWVAAAGSVDAVVPQLFGSGSPTNVLGYNSPEVDELLARAAITGDDVARWMLYSAVQELITTDARAVPIGTSMSQLVVAPQALGLVVRADGSLDLRSRE